MVDLDGGASTQKLELPLQVVDDWVDQLPGVPLDVVELDHPAADALLEGASDFDDVGMVEDGEGGGAAGAAHVRHLEGFGELGVKDLTSLGYLIPCGDPPDNKYPMPNRRKTVAGSRVGQTPNLHQVLVAVLEDLAQSLSAPIAADEEDGPVGQVDAFVKRGDAELDVERDGLPFHWVL